MRAPILAAIVLFGVGGAAVRSDAVTLYSIDNLNDALVRIDSQSGKVVTIGPTGVGFNLAQMAYLGGYIYAINTVPNCSDPTFVALNKIDPTTGVGLEMTAITIDGVPLDTFVADALTTDGSKLIMSLRDTGEPCGGAYRLADLSVTAALTNISEPFSSSADMDNLAVDEAGQVYALDGMFGSPNYRSDFYRVTRPSTYVLLGSHFNAGVAVYSGTVFTPDGNLWTLERTAGTATLRRLDPATGQVLQTVPLQTALTLRGLALGPSPVNGTSTTVSLLGAFVIAGAGALMLARRGRVA